MRPLLLILLLGGCVAPPLPPPPRTPPPPHDVEEPVFLPAQTIEPEAEVTPPLTRATLPVPPPPRSVMGNPVVNNGTDDNPYAGQVGPPKGRPPRGFPVPSMAIPKR